LLALFTGADRHALHEGRPAYSVRSTTGEPVRTSQAAAQRVRGGLTARERVGFLPGGGSLRAVGQVRRPQCAAERGLVGDVVGPAACEVLTGSAAACEVLTGSPVVLRTEYAGLPSCRAWRSAPVNNASNDVARLRARPPAVPAQEGT
jgi:hypothetical protein